MKKVFAIILFALVLLGGLVMVLLRVFREAGAAKSGKRMPR